MGFWNQHVIGFYGIRYMVYMLKDRANFFKG
jgi:hypothetical protein